MTLDMIIEEKIKAKEEGFNDGFSNGFSDGFSDGFTDGYDEANLKNAVISIKELNIPIDVIAEKFSIDMETLRKALNEEK